MSSLRKIVAIPVLWCALSLCAPGGPSRASFDRDMVADAHREGRAVFYRFLRQRAAGFPLETDDLRLLLAGEDRLSHLYDRLMNFYFWLQDWTDLDESDFRERYKAVSARMALELLISIPSKSPFPNISPLKLVLRSAGCEASSRAPDFRRHRRPINRFIKDQWAFEELDIFRIHDHAKGKNVRIAVIDTGLDPSIKELRARSRKRKNLLDDALPAGEKGRYPYDWDGHGTSVSTVVHQIAPAAELMIVKFYDNTTMKGYPASRWTGYLIAAGLRWAAFHGADVINLSATVREDLEPIRSAIRYCWDHNIVVVTSMGNVFDEPVRRRIYYPASYPWTIAVGGVEKSEESLHVWPFSARGDYVDVVAPAMRLFVEVPSYRSRRRSANVAYGNSYATAIVSGAAALVLSSMEAGARDRLKTRPGQLSETVREILRGTASNERLGFRMPNPDAGYGMVDIGKAVALAQAGWLHWRRDPRRKTTSLISGGISPRYPGFDFKGSSLYNKNGP